MLTMKYSDPRSYSNPNYAIFAATLFWIGSKKIWAKLFLKIALAIYNEKRTQC